MHELGIVTSLLDAVETQARQAGVRRVVGINLALGERCGLVDESLRFYFDQLASETLAAGAHLTVRRLPWRFHCAACGSDFSPADGEFDCPRCGVSGQLVDDGTAMRLESIEVER